MFISNITTASIRALAIHSVVVFHNCCDELREKYGEISKEHVHIVAESEPAGKYYLVTEIPCDGMLYEFTCDDYACVGLIRAYKKFVLLDRVEDNNEPDPQHENWVLSGL
jgi:hypothetical protein